MKLENPGSIPHNFLFTVGESLDGMKPLKEFKKYRPTKSGLPAETHFFLQQSQEAFKNGLNEASIMYCSQAVEIALIKEIHSKYDEEGRLDDFKKDCKNNRIFPFGRLINIIECELRNTPNWVLNVEHLEKAKELRDFRNSYVHYLNRLLSVPTQAEGFDKRVEMLTRNALEKRGTDFNDYKEKRTTKEANKIVNKLLEKKLKNVKKILEDVEPLRWVEIEENTRFIQSKHDVLISKSVPENPFKIIFWGTMKSLKAIVSKKMVAPSPGFKESDALESIKLSFDILEYLGYVKQ